LCFPAFLFEVAEGRLDLLGKLPPYSFVVPEEVVKEVTRSDQAQALQTAISSGLLRVVQLTVPAELKVYADLIQILGSGAGCLSSWSLAY
jgi:hypothetical protein